MPCNLSMTLTSISFNKTLNILFRLFSNAITIKAGDGTSVITPDPEFIRKVQITTTKDEENIEDLDDSIDEEIEIVCSVATKTEPGMHLHL